MIDINELRRLTQAATLGGWYVKRGNHIYGCKEVTDGEEKWHPVIACTDDDEVNVNFEANAAFIAAANPAAISELLDRLEAAEKERDALRAAVRHEADCVEAAMAEIKPLRAKIEAMEQQEPVATVIKEGDSRYWMSKQLWTFPDGKYPLYALPGAKGE